MSRGGSERAASGELAIASGDNTKSLLLMGVHIVMIISPLGVI